MKRYSMQKGEIKPFVLSITNFLGADTLDWTTMIATPAEYFAVDAGLSVVSQSYDITAHTVTVVVDTSAAVNGVELGLSIKLVTVGGLVDFWNAIITTQEIK